MMSSEDHPMRPTWKTASLVALGGILLAATACSPGGPVEFEPYSDDAVNNARIEMQPVLIKATADW